MNRLFHICVVIAFNIAVLITLSSCFDSSSSSLTAKDPLSMPPTISKLDNGIDPTSIQFTYLDSSSSINSIPLNSETDDSAIIGTLSGHTILEETYTIGVYKEGMQLDTFETSSDGSFSYSVTSNLLGACRTTL